MNWQQVITTFILIAGVFLGVLEGIHLADLLKQKLPSHTRLALEQFARMAVQKVEKQSLDLSGTTKKQLAIASVGVLFNEYKLPIPTMEAIDIAIESAVLMLPRAVTARPGNPPKLVEPTKNE